MTMILLLAAGIAFFLNAFFVSLVLIALAILENTLVILRATLDPDWVLRRRIEAGVHVDFSNPSKHIFGLISTKVLLLWVLGFFAYRVSVAGGFF